MYDQYVPLPFIRVKDDQKRLIWDLKVVGLAHALRQKKTIHYTDFGYKIVLSKTNYEIQEHFQLHGMNSQRGFNPPTEENTNERAHQQLFQNKNVILINIQMPLMFHKNLAFLALLILNWTENMILGCKFSVSQFKSLMMFFCFIFVSSDRSKRNQCYLSKLKTV